MKPTETQELVMYCGKQVHITELVEDMLCSGVAPEQVIQQLGRRLNLKEYWDARKAAR
ncbi:MAG TPA: hypothetical protein VGK96_28310 [Candidatus Sulfotelmatobacter sp.]|jgi:hypothetical protein